MDNSAWTFAFQVINALVLIWLLSRYLFSPVADMITTRQKAANQLLDEARDSRTQADIDQLKITEHLNTLTMEHHMAMEATTLEAANLKEELMAQARSDANELLEQTRRELILLRHQFDNETRTQATILALDIADKLMQKLPLGFRVMGFVDGLIDGLHKLSEQARKSLANDTEKLKLVTAYPISEQDKAEILKAVTRILEDEVTIEVSEDSSLIAGLELIGSHCAVRYSLRADLAQLSTVLSGNNV